MKHQSWIKAAQFYQNKDGKPIFVFIQRPDKSDINYAYKVNEPAFFNQSNNNFDDYLTYKWSHQRQPEEKCLEKLINNYN